MDNIGDKIVAFFSIVAIIIIIGFSLEVISLIIKLDKENKEWHEKCHYEYTDLLGGSGTAYNCSMTRGSIVCDGSVQVVKYWEVCDK